jgi:hypothetical protein
MIQITPQMRILVAVEAVDGRKGIDSLARLCQERLQTYPFSGCLFVFRSRRITAIRILAGAEAAFERAISLVAGRAEYARGGAESGGASTASVVGGGTPHRLCGVVLGPAASGRPRPLYRLGGRSAPS